MKLGKIRDYMKQRGAFPLSDIAIHFDISKEAAALALQYWQRKGKVRSQGSSCGSSCGGCGDANENYQWVSDVTRIHWFR